MPGSATDPDSTGVLFSIEPERRAIEIVFIRRLLDLLGEDAANLLAASRQSSAESSFDADPARLPHPPFALLAQVIENDISEALDYGKFSADGKGKRS